MASNAAVDNQLTSAANSLGNVGQTPVTTLYTIVHAQQNTVYFNGASGNVPVPSLWTSYWSSELAMVCKYGLRILPFLTFH